jgi:hypothetical protein
MAEKSSRTSAFSLHPALHAHPYLCIMGYRYRQK